MAKKLPLKVAKLEQLTSKQYVKLLNRMLKFIPDGVQTKFILITNHVFQDIGDMKSERLPLLLPGEMPQEWIKFFRSKKSDPAQKKFASMGRLTIREDKAPDGKLKGRKVTLEIDEGNKRIKQKKQQFLGKLLERLKHTLDIEGAAGGQIDEETNATKASANKVAAAATKEAMHEVKSAGEVTRLKEELREQKKAMNEKATAFWNAVKKVNSQVIPKIKEGKTTKRKDLAIIQNAYDALKAFVLEFDELHDRVQKDFKSMRDKMEKQAKQFHVLGKKAKEQKKTLAQELADTYFMRKNDRLAEDAEIQAMQASLKAAIDYRKVASLPKHEKALNLKAIYYTARFRGPSFAAKDTDVVFKEFAFNDTMEGNVEDADD
ncbi:MAG: hypothetical protein GY810_13400 [Aureispira sp.]|nr:hypothetical protein [Aureispira sp.]